MANILVTGGGGYIGSHACMALSLAGHVPITFDNFSTGWPAAVRFGPLEIGDLRDTDRVREVLRRWAPSAVLHFAAFSEVADSYRDPQAYWSNNVGSALSLLDAMRAEGVDRLVYSSTCAVNGEQDGHRLDENSAVGPVSPYGETKLALEMAVAEQTHGLRALGLRYFNVAGAAPAADLGECHLPETHLIPRVLQAIQTQNSPFSIFGDDYPTRDGTCIRDYIHVLDVAEAHVAALDYLETPNRMPVLCLGTGRGMSIYEVISTARIVTQQKVSYHIAPRRQGDPASLVCGSTRARRLLNWTPQRSTPERMIGDAWLWQTQGSFRKWHKRRHPKVATDRYQKAGQYYSRASSA